MKKTTLSFLFLFSLYVSMHAQVPVTSELYIAMRIQDSVFFERGFNQCDIAYLEKAIHSDFSFYHDQGGIQDRKGFFESIRKNICPDTDGKPIRKVSVESLEVYPLFNNGVLYGAIQNGTHYFYRRKPGMDDVHTSTAKFTHVYLLENEKWILKQVLSFDHKNP